MAYGSSQSRGRIEAAALPTPQLLTTLDPEHTEGGQGSNNILRDNVGSLTPLSHNRNSWSVTLKYCHFSLVK